MTHDALVSVAKPTPKRTVRGDEGATLNELVELLSAHPRGLRRWSVMRAIRASRSGLGRDIPHKFEDEVERIFRRHCAGDAETGSTTANVLFHRPKETAGEVWAVLKHDAEDPPPSE
jgi:hypothetical protein